MPVSTWSAWIRDGIREGRGHFLKHFEISPLILQDKFVAGRVQESGRVEILAFQTEFASLLVYEGIAQNSQRDQAQPKNRLPRDAKILSYPGNRLERFHSVGIAHKLFEFIEAHRTLNFAVGISYDKDGR
jgi:hypothetical protein